MTPHDSPVLTFTPVYSPLPHSESWPVWPPGDWGSDSVWLYKDITASASLSFGSPALDGRQRHVVRTLKQPYGEVHLVRNGHLLPRATTKSPGMWLSHLGKGSSSPNGAVRWPGPQPTSRLQLPEGPWARTTQWSHFLDSWPEETVR